MLYTVRQKDKGETNMKLLTKDILKKLPPLYASENLESMDDVKIPLKLFNPGGAQTWYIVEYSPTERLFYGMCDLFGNQEDMSFGYISQDEIEQFRGRFGLGIERDAWWDFHTTVKQVLSKEKR